MSLAYSGVEPQPSLAWQFESSNVDSVTGLAPSSQVSPGPAQLVGSAALVTNAPTSNTAVYFPGTVNDYMNLGTSTPTNFDASTSNVFFEAWINWTDLSGQQRVYGRYVNPQATSSLNLYMRKLSDNTLQVSGGSGNSASNSTALSTGVWYHIAFSSIPGGSSYVFVNGVPGTGTSLTYTAHNATYNTYIGSGASQYLSGYIRDLRVVQGGVVPTTSFTPGSAPFSYTLPSYVTGSGSVVFTLLGQFVTYVPGKYGNAVYINNEMTKSTSTSNAWIVYSSLSGYGLTVNNFSISSWIYPYTINTSFTNTFFNMSPSAPYYTQFQLSTSGSKSVATTFTNGSGYNVLSSGNLSIAQWSHHCITYSNVGATTVGNVLASYYINGVIQATSNIPQVAAGNTPLQFSVLNKLELGSSGVVTGAAANSALDDLRIYNTALTAAQVQSVYSSQGAPVPSRAMPLPQYAWDFQSSNVDYVSSLSPTTSVGPPTYNSAGKYGSSIVFNNTPGATPGTYYLTYTTGISLSTASGFTVCAWIKPLAVGVSGNQTFLSIAGQNTFFIFQIDSSATNIHLFGQNPFTVPNNINGSASSVTQSTWIHAVMVFSGTSITTYYNGTLKDSLSLVVSPVTFSALGLGNRSAINADSAANGELDDLRIYNTALTAAQVRSIWAQQGVPGRGAGITQYIKSATGGDTVQDIGGYRIHTFTTVGTSTFTPATSGLVEVLIVAGGGGGGGCASNQTGGGGGAGELYYKQNYPVSAGALTVTVGNGGTGGVGGTSAATAGGNSVFGSLTCAGGGKGGDRSFFGNIGGPGGSGGGAARNSGAGGVLGGASTATIGFGNIGGNTLNSVTNGAGGGGAGSPGSNGDNTVVRPAGGSGLGYSISGTSITYAVGGQGGLRAGSSNGANGAANTGNGADGGDGNAITSGGAGGSGIVIVRYPISGPVNMTGTPLFTQLSTAATSSAVGAFSLRAVNGTTVKAVAVQAHPVVQWPPVSMTSNTTVVSSQLYGNGTYVASDLSGGVVPTVFNMSDNNINTFYEQYYTGANYYDYNRGTLIDTTKTTTVSGATAAGWWVQLQLPASIILRSYTLAGRQDNRFWETRNPTTFWIAGSNDGSNWSNVHYQAGISYGQSGTTISVPQTSNSLAYSYYRLIVNVIGNSGASGNHSTLDIATWNLYGDSPSYAPNATQDFYADRLGNLLTAPVTGQSLANWLGGATGYVTTWYDQSGRGNNATQGTAANQPIITRATKGPGYACYFNGTTNILTVSSSGTLDGTNYSVCTSSRRNKTGEMYYIGTNGPSSTRNQLSVGYYNDTQTILNEYSYAQVGATIPGYSSGVEPVGYDYSLFSQTNGMYVYNWRSGTSYAAGSTGLTLPMTSSGSVTIGFSAWGGGTKYFSGEIFEVLIFNSSLFDLSGSIPATYTTPPSIVQAIYNNQVGIYGT